MTQSASPLIRDLPENPFILYSKWREDAEDKEINDASAACLATATKDGIPSARMVLVKSWDENGFYFHTNEQSRKGREFTDNPHVALCIHWKSLRRQVRIEGSVTETTSEAADTYFATRSRESRLGAWASQQSRPLNEYEDLIQSHEDYKAKFEGQDDIPRPPYWKGFCITPQSIEFWMDGDHRLHKRFVYTLEDNGSWTISMLNP